MSGSGGSGGPEADILKLGIDAAGVKRGADQAEAALESIKDAAQEAGAALDKVAPSAGAAGAGLQKIPAPAQQAGAGLSGAAAGASAAGAALGKIPAAAGAAAGAAEKTRDSAGKAAAAFREWEKALAALEGATAKVRPRVEELTQQFQRTGMVTEQAARRMAEMHVAMDESRKRAIALGQGFSDLRMGPNGLEKVAASATGTAAALRGASAGMQGLATNARLTARELQMLAPQLNDIFTQLSMGQGIMMTAFAQGPQIVQGFGGVVPTLTRIVQVVGAARLAMLGFAGAGAAAVLSHNAHEAALASLRGRLRTVTEDYREAATAVEASARRMARSMTGVGRSEATDAQVALRGAARGLGPLDMDALVADIADFSRSIAGDFAGATQLMTRLMRDPAGALQDLAEKGLPGVDRALVTTVDALVRGGSRGEAFALALGRIRQQTRDAREDISPLARAWDDLSKAMGEFWDKIAPAVRGAGAVLLDWLTTFVRGVGQVVDLIGRLRSGASIDAGPVSLGEVGSARTGRGGAPLLFGSALAAVESGGTPGRVGPGNVLGTYQFTAARLAELGLYQPAPGERMRDAGGRLVNSWQGGFAIPGFEQVTNSREFLGNAQAQQAAFERHLAAIDLAIDSLGVLGGDSAIGGVRVNRDGLRAVAHLGGEEGMRRFVATGGGYNPADANGTSLMDYFRAFSVQADRVEVASERTTLEGQGGAPLLPMPPASGQVISVSGRDPALERALGLARGESNPVSTGQGRETNLANLTRAIEDMRAAREALRGALSQGLLSPEEAAAARGHVDLLTAGIERLSSAHEQARSPVERWIEETRRAAAVAAEAGEPTQQLTERMQAFDQAMRSQGIEVGAADRMRVMAAEVEKLNVAFASVTREADRQIASTQRLTRAYLEGDQQGARVSERERAIAEVRRAGVQGAEAQRAAVEALTEKYRALTTAEVDRQSAAGVRDTERQMELLEAEARLAGVTADQRERELAALRERQRIQRAGGDVGSDASRRAIATAQQLADARRETEWITNSWREAENVGVRAFERIGEAITQALATGEMKALRFANIWRATMSEAVQAGLKLAVINPTMNAVFGGSRATIGGLLAGGGEKAAMSPGIDLGSLLLGRGLASSAGGNATTGIGFLDSGIAGLNSLLQAPLWGSAASSASPAAAALGAEAFAEAPAHALGMGSPASSAPSLGGLLAGAGYAYGAYSGFQRGGVGGAVQGIGNAAALAMLATGFGAPLAPFVGIGSALLGSVLPGQQPSNREGNATLNLDTGGVWIGGQDGGKYSQGNRDMASATVREAREAARRIEALTGGRVGGGEMMVGVGDRDGVFARMDGQELGRWGRDEAGIRAMSDELARQLVFKMEGGFADALKHAVFTGAARTQGEIGQAASFLGGPYQAARDTIDGVGEFDRRMRELTRSFDESAAQARRLNMEMEAQHIEWAKLHEINVLNLQRQRAIEDTGAGYEQRAAAARGDRAGATRLGMDALWRQQERERFDFGEAMRDMGLPADQMEAMRARLEAALLAEWEAAVRAAEAALREVRRGIEDTELGYAGRAAQAGGVQGDILAQQQRAQRLAHQRQVEDLEAFLAAQTVGAEEAARLRAELQRAIAAESAAIIRQWEALWREQAAAVEGITARLMRAQATVSGSAPDAQAADLYAFDAAASREISATRDTLRTLGLTADQVETQIGRLTQALELEREALIAAYETRRQAISDSLADRLFAATTDTSTQQGALAAFERAAQRERAEAAREGLTDLVELERVHAAERARLLEDFARQAEASLRASGGSIRAFLDALATGGVGNYGSPTDQFSAAQGVFGRDLALARSNDQDALRRITGSAETLLATAERMFGSSESFQAIRRQVEEGLGGLPAVQSYDALILEELKRIGGGITVETVIAADLALRAQIDAAVGAIDSTEASEDAKAEAEAVLAQITGVMAVLSVPTAVTAAADLAARTALSSVVAAVSRIAIPGTVTAAARTRANASLANIVGAIGRISLAESVSARARERASAHLGNIAGAVSRIAVAATVTQAARERAGDALDSIVGAIEAITVSTAVTDAVKLAAQDALGDIAAAVETVTLAEGAVGPAYDTIMDTFGAIAGTVTEIALADGITAEAATAATAQLQSITATLRAIALAPGVTATARERASAALANITGAVRGIALAPSVTAATRASASAALSNIVGAVRRIALAEGVSDRTRERANAHLSNIAGAVARISVASTVTDLTRTTANGALATIAGAVADIAVATSVTDEARDAADAALANIIGTVASIALDPAVTEAVSVAASTALANIAGAISAITVAPSVTAAARTAAMGGLNSIVGAISRIAIARTVTDTARAHAVAALDNIAGSVARIALARDVADATRTRANNLLSNIIGAVEGITLDPAVPAEVSVAASAALSGIAGAVSAIAIAPSVTTAARLLAMDRLDTIVGAVSAISLAGSVTAATRARAVNALSNIAGAVARITLEGTVTAATRERANAHLSHIVGAVRRITLDATVTDATRTAAVGALDDIAAAVAAVTVNEAALAGAATTLLDTLGSLTATVEATVDATMAEQARQEILGLIGAVSSVIGVTSDITAIPAEQRAVLFASSDTISRQLALAATGGGLTPDQRRILAAEMGTISRTVDNILAGTTTLTADQRAMLMAVSGTIQRQINNAVETTETVEISRSIDDKLSGILASIEEGIVSLIATSSAGFASVAMTIAANAGRAFVQAGNFAPGTVDNGLYVSPGQALGRAGMVPGSDNQRLPLSDEAFVRMLYQTFLRREPDPEGLAHYVNSLRTGTMSRASAIDWFFMDARTWGSPTAFQEGGWIGNGVWNRDSVIARYAGGGDIMLAGGEHVTNAVQAARYAPELNAINAGIYPRGASNDNGRMLAELRSLREAMARMSAELAALRGAAQRAADAGERTAEATEDTAASSRAMARDAGVVAARRRRAG